MTRGLFFGLTTVDIFNLVPPHPAANLKVKSERQELYAGGPAKVLQTSPSNTSTRGIGSTISTSSADQPHEK